MSDTRTYTFADVRLDCGRMTLERGGVPVDVEPKGFDVLLFLIEERERLVTKEELLEKVWAGTFVTANALTRVIAQLRKAIGDDAQEGRYIQTIAKRGYRFVAPVEVVGSAGEPPQAPSLAPTAGPERRRRTWWWAAAAAIVVLIAGAAAATRMMRERPAASSAPLRPRLERVTMRLGYNGQPAISPDGRLVAYVSDRTGSNEIYVTAFTPGAQEVAITSDGNGNVGPAWSPDGEWIAFQSEKRSGIWVVSSTGGVARQVTEFGSHPEWSPDGQTILFQSTPNALSVLWLVRRDGSGMRQLTQPENPRGAHLQPTWSESGRWIALVVYRLPSQWDVEVLSPLSGEHRLIARGAWNPRFTDGDRSIVYVTGIETKSAVIVRRPFDEKTGTAGEKVEIVQALGGLADGLSVARNGKMVASIAQPDANLWAIDLDEDLRAGEPRRLTSDSVRNGRASYGPDGRLTFIRAGVGARQTTWIMNDDGTRLEPLVADRENAQPQWASDGKRILVRYDTKPDESHLYWVDLATRRMVPLPMNANEMEISSLSPDGRELAYHSGRSTGTLNVFTRSVEGGPGRQITFDSEGATYPVFSPDGKWIALELKRGGDTHIAVVSRDGGPLRILTRGPGQNWPFSWSPDGRWIAFAGERGGTWNIYAVAADTGEIRQLTKLTTGGGGYVRYPTWSPDGKRIVFERSQMNAGVWVVRGES